MKRVIQRVKCWFDKHAYDKPVQVYGIYPHGIPMKKSCWYCGKTLYYVERL